MFGLRIETKESSKMRGGKHGIRMVERVAPRGSSSGENVNWTLLRGWIK